MRDCVLVFIDGTICDLQHRHKFKGTADFEKESEIMQDKPVGDAVKCMNELYKLYDLVYIGARSENTGDMTRKWLTANGYPDGLVIVGSSQKNRMTAVRKIKNTIHFVAGIGDRWDDNELHLELGCMSKRRVVKSVNYVSETTKVSTNQPLRIGNVIQTGRIFHRNRIGSIVTC